MYKIIGADQRVYGPITADQMRQWIAQGRVNMQTQVQMEGTNDWRPLSAFPEFASLASSMAPLSPIAPGGDRETALQAVKGPAIGLMVTAITGMFFVALGLVMHVLALAGVTSQRQTGDPELDKILGMMNSGALGLFSDLIGIVVGIVILNGASKMRRLENHQFVFVASILALIPCISPCCFLGLPFGIWALVVLNKPEIKAHFT